MPAGEPAGDRRPGPEHTEADASPAHVLTRVDRLLPWGTWKRLERQRDSDRVAGRVPEPKRGWIYRERLRSILVEPLLSGLYSRLLSGAEPFDPEVTALVGAAPTLALWRMTRGLYRVDPTLLGALAETKLDHIPVEVLQHLPEYAPYLDLSGCDWPGYEIEGQRLRGAWLAVLPSEQTHAVLSIAALHEGNLVVPYQIPLTHASLTDCLQNLAASVQEVRPAVQALRSQQGLPPLPPLSPEALLSHDRLTRLVLNVALYLCVDEPDITGVVKQPSLHPKKREHGPALPQRDNVLEVGYRLGGAIRGWREGARRDGTGGDGVGPAKAPHIRRAHWAVSWTGPGREVPRLVWRPPTAINLRNLDTLAVHVRAVPDEPRREEGRA